MKVRFYTSTGVVDIDGVKEHSLVDMKASTQHKLTFAKGVIVYVPDFGIRNTMIIPDGVSPYDLPQL